MACATCHDPNHAFGPANALPVQLGGGDLRQPGLRAVPSLKYLQVVPQFTEHFFDIRGRWRRERRQRPDRRADVGRPRRLAATSRRAFRCCRRSRWRNLSAGARLSPRPCAAGYGAGACRRSTATHVVDDRSQRSRGLMKALEVYRAGLAAPSTPTAASTTPTWPARPTLTPQEASGLEAVRRARPRATAPAATSASAAATAPRRSSPTSA